MPVVSDAWVPVAAAAVGATPGLVAAWWTLRRSGRQRRDDLIRVAVRNLLAEAMSAAYRPSVFGSPAGRRALWFRMGRVLDQLDVMESRLGAVLAAKAEFDLLVDNAAMHDAADALLQAVVDAFELYADDKSLDDEAAERAAQGVKAARLQLIGATREVMPGLVRDRRRLLRRSA